MLSKFKCSINFRNQIGALTCYFYLLQGPRKSLVLSKIISHELKKKTLLRIKKIIYCHYLGSPGTLAEAYTNASPSGEALNTYPAGIAVTVTCNSGYLSSATPALVATCASSGDTWTLAANTAAGSCAGK